MYSLDNMHSSPLYETIYGADSPSAAAASCLEIKYYIRVHLFLNGSLANGKALSFTSETPLPVIHDLAIKKFNLHLLPQQQVVAQDKTRRNIFGEQRSRILSAAPASLSAAPSQQQQQQQHILRAAPPFLDYGKPFENKGLLAASAKYPQIRLFTLKGAEIEETCEIVHDDVLFVVQEDEEFVYPLPLEHVLMFQGPQTRSRLVTLNKRPPFRQFFDKFIPDLFYLVFSFLDYQELGLIVSLVCKDWYKMANSEHAWRELCANVYYWTERRRRERKLFEEEGRSPLSSFAAANADMRAIFSTQPSSPIAPQSPAARVLSEFCLKSVLTRFHSRKAPPIYKSWKTYYRYYIIWALSLTWDSTERGANIKFKNNNMSLFRDDNITYHWQTVRSSLPIFIPSEQQKKQNGLFDGNPDDIAVHEYEICVDCFDKTHSNGWWVVFGLETDHFTYKESNPTNLIGYDRNMGWGYACGNGDTLHCYSNQSLKNKQQFTCEPIKPWINVPYKQGDIVRARVKYYTKHYADPVDPKENIGATLEFFLNGKYLGQAYRNITTSVVYPAVSILPNQMVTLRHVDPMSDDYTTV